MRSISGWMASSINKICVIGQTTIHMYSMSHHCIPNYGLESFMGRRRHWAVLLPWWSRLARYCEWKSLPFKDNRIFLAPIGYYGLGGHVVPTEWRHKPHSEHHNQFIGNQVCRTCFLTKWSSRLADDWPCDLTPLDYFLWSYTKSMAYANKPATINEVRANIEWIFCSIVRFMLENRQKLGSASGLLQACPWWPCKRNRASFIMPSSALLHE